MLETLRIIHWPDPRLLKISRPVTVFNDDLRALAERMFELMRASKGVGLAAPQVGQNIRLFVMNHSGRPEDDRVYVNPELLDAAGEEEGEEGCLSLPDIHVKILRASNVVLKARDANGAPVEERNAGYIARIWQHEFDHLNGTLLTDRMGSVARLANRRILSDLKTKFELANPAPAPARKRLSRR